MADSTTNLDLLSFSQYNKETVANALFDALSPASLFGRRDSAIAGLTWAYYGGDMVIDGVLTSIANGTVALTGSSTNYVEASRAGVVSKNTTGFTAGSIPLYTVVTGTSSISSYTDVRTTSYQYTGMISKSVAGSSNVTLTAAEARNNIINLIGTLTGNIQVIVPLGPQAWVFKNSTSGNFTVTVIGASGTGIIIPQNSTLVVFSDGTNVNALLSTVATESFALSGDISPAQITSNQNDYNPTGLSTASVLRLSSNASRDITGLQGGSDGRILFIHNVGSNNIVLKDESASSTAANRFALTGDITLAGDTGVTIQYDSTSSRWRAVSGELNLGMTPTWIGVHTWSPSQAANTSVDGIVLSDTTAATSGNQQYSPRLRLTGQGWKTDATASSRTVDWIMENRPVQGAANPSTVLAYASQINAGGYTDKLHVTSDGVLRVSGNTSSSPDTIETALGLAGVSFQLYGSDSANAGIAFSSWGSSASLLLGYMNGGTAASPSASAGGSNIFIIGARGHTGSGYTGSKASISMQTVNAWSTTDNSTKMLFRVTPTGSITLTTGLILDGTGTVVGPTDPGGSAALRVNGDLLTTDPTSGTGPAWKLGAVKAGAVVADTANYVEVLIGGSTVKLIKAT